MSYYGVFRGRRTGIFKSWPEAREQVDGFHRAVHKRFFNQREAEEFVHAVEAEIRRTERGQLLVRFNGANAVVVGSLKRAVRKLLRMCQQRNGVVILWCAFPKRYYSSYLEQYRVKHPENKFYVWV